METRTSSMPVKFLNQHDRYPGDRYSGHKYYFRMTFTDAEGATPSNAQEIKLVTGTANCATDYYDVSALRALPATKLYDNLCSGLGYRRPQDVIYGTYEATHGPIYQGDIFCFIHSCTAPPCPSVRFQYGFYM